MSLQSQLTALAQAVGGDIKNLNTALKNGGGGGGLTSTVGLYTSDSRPTPVGNTGMVIFVVDAPATKQYQGSDGANWVALATGLPTVISLTYVSDGDINGVVYWLGTRSGSFATPVPALGTTSTADGIELRLDASGIYGGQYQLAQAVNRALGDPFASSEGAGSWLRFDFKTRAMKPTRYSLRTRGDADVGQPRSWVLEASNDALAWTTLDTRTGQTTFAGLNTWFTFTCTASTFYRYLRLRQTAVNSASTNYFALGEVEFYGDLST